MMNLISQHIAIYLQDIKNEFSRLINNIKSKLKYFILSALLFTTGKLYPEKLICRQTRDKQDNLY